jgi:L-fuconolactonase
LGAHLPVERPRHCSPRKGGHGSDRCLWGTDCTRAFAVVEQAVVPFLKTDRLSDAERAMLMGGACAKAYGWSLKKG